MVRAYGLVLGFAVLAVPGVVEASGLALREFSSTAQGNAYAGATAGAEDISYMAFNPAGITRHRGRNFAVNAIAIAPQSEFSSDGATTVLGGAIGGGNGGGDVAPDVVVPALFYSQEISPELFAGVSLTVPFGLSTHFDSGWVGRYHALKSDIATYNLNPVLAYKVNPALSVAGGIQVAYTRGVLTNAVDFGTLDVANFSGAFGGTPTQDDGVAEIEGDDIALGFNLGILYELAPGTRVGLAYRSKLHHRLDGAANFNNGTVGDAIAASTGLFTRSGARAEMNLPETISAGIHHDLNERVALMAEVAWTAWHRLHELRVKYDNTAQSDTVIPEHWKNTWFVAVGATWQANERWTLRTGLAYDQTPTSDAYRTPRVPDGDRTWLSLGASYQFSPGLGLDIGYTHLFVDEAAIQLSTSETDNQLRGNLNGSFDNAADVLAVQLRVLF